MTISLIRLRLAAALCLSTSFTAFGAFAQSPPAAEPPADDHAPEEGVELEGLVVQATRSGRRVQDEPIPVDIINREEIEEKLLMRPGNISVMLSETGGLRVQVTSPGLGSSNVRVQGMRGRYTQLLSDGLPLYGGQASSIGLLQIAPTDLRQVEVIKGAASALYGPSALGGVINLVSRRPGEAPEGEVLLNATSRDGQDVTAYGATPLTERLGVSLVAGGHRQSRQDLDDDGWADMPGYERWTLRPRLFWEGDNAASAYVTLGVMDEARRGGTLPGAVVPDGGPFPESQDSRRYDGGLVAYAPLGGGELQLRASAMQQRHRHLFGDVQEDDRHETAFAEAAFSADAGRTSWLGGLAVQSDSYRSKTFPSFDYSFTTPAVFVQAEHELRNNLTIAGSARWDSHSEYGDRVSPRLSMLYRPGPWTFRASIGRGFYAPTPFVEEVEAIGLSRLEPLLGIKEETAESASLEGGYTAGPIEANVTLFASNIHDAVRLEESPLDSQRVRLVITAGETRTGGAELLLRYRWSDFTVTGSYVYVDASEPGEGGAGRRTIPLTPRHTGGVVAMWEKHGKGRIGFEAYYTGRQDLEDNPYRSRSKPYLEVGLLGEVAVGRARLFLNLENILDVRQSKHDPLLLPARAPDGRWTVDAWAPTEGFVANGGVRLSFGGG